MPLLAAWSLSCLVSRRTSWETVFTREHSFAIRTLVQKRVVRQRSPGRKSKAKTIIWLTGALIQTSDCKERTKTILNYGFRVLLKPTLTASLSDCDSSFCDLQSRNYQINLLSPWDFSESDTQTHFASKEVIISWNFRHVLFSMLLTGYLAPFEIISAFVSSVGSWKRLICLEIEL